MHGETASRRRKRYRHHAEIVDADAGEAGFLALRVLVRKEVEGLVFFERAAECESALRACVGLLDRIEIAGGGVDLSGKGVARLKSLVAQKTKDVAVKLVAAVLGDDVDYPAGGAAVLGVVVAEDELEFLDALLRDGGADTVDGVVSGIGAVYADHVSTSARSANIESAIGGRADGGRDVAGGLRVGERKDEIVPPVAGEVVNAALLDGLRDFRLASFDRSGFRRHRHRLLHAFEVQTRIKRRGFADGENNGSILIDCKVCAAIDGHFVLAGRKPHKVVAPAIIGDGGPLGAGACVGHGDLCALDR